MTDQSKTPRPLTPKKIDGILKIKEQWEEIGRLCGGTAEVILPDDVQEALDKKPKTP